ncbi:hypothetical protein [Actinoplanes xinjiangensis]|uniref:Uncharacterized protein n=1 Tax=Actinoplanes xinjiangensis TaxID=512350 RepID=A0A316FLP4_9ACTN|nr:hypothetical protein [Actinoplanes xinjiangensis]PWK49449.1 hypothetical protein BC793_104122 [Actinoplanes xinjiangensis]GIF37454.1 hypothetical protein Axi01nite_17650 [Actinoplanes xinjiangensis]
MNAHEPETTTTSNHHDTNEQHPAKTSVPPLPTDDHGDDMQTTRTLAELLGEPEPIRHPHDVQWFTATLLAHPSKAVQTAPVIAMVAELLDILRDDHISDQQAHHALRRAVRWLRIFTTEPPGPTNRHHPDTGRRNYAASTTNLAAAAASRQLATTWLRGTPQAAIRTAPVIGVVDQLHADLQYSTSNRDAQSRLRHAVALLDVFVTDDQTAPQLQ